MTEYLDEVIRPLVLILPKISGYVKTFEEKNNKLMSSLIDDDGLLEKCKSFGLKLKIKKDLIKCFTSL